jgi:hypothetical protein
MSRWGRHVQRALVSSSIGNGPPSPMTQLTHTHPPGFGSAPQSAHRITTGEWPTEASTHPPSRGPGSPSWDAWTTTPGAVSGPPRLRPQSPSTTPGEPRARSVSPAAVLAELRVEIDEVIENAPTEAPTNKPAQSRRPSETSDGRADTITHTGSNFTRTARADLVPRPVVSHTRAQPPKRQKTTRPLPKPHPATLDSPQVVHQGKGAISFTLPPGRGSSDAAARLRKTSIRQSENTSYTIANMQRARLAAANSTARPSNPLQHKSNTALPYNTCTSSDIARTPPR